MRGVKHAAASCSVANCEAVPRKRSYCEMHYRRWRRHGDATVAQTARGLSDEARFWTHVSKGAACWIWNSELVKGYGRFKRSDGTRIMAHRFAYEVSGATIPDGLTIDHLCNVSLCVNPAHMEPVTQGENNRRRGERMRNARTQNR